MPIRNPKECTLTDTQRTNNRAIPSERIYIEQTISGKKGDRYLNDRLRTHTVDLNQLAIDICAVLWIFFLPILLTVSYKEGLLIGYIDSCCMDKLVSENTSQC